MKEEGSKNQRKQGQLGRPGNCLDGLRIHLLNRKHCRHLGSSEIGRVLTIQQYTQVYFMEHYLLEGMLECAFLGAADPLKI